MNRIEIEKSIDRRRMVYRMSAGFVFNQVLMHVVILILVILAIALTGPATLTFQDGAIRMLFYLLAAGFSCWLFASLVLVNRFVMRKGGGDDENRSKTIPVLKKHFPKMVVRVDAANAFIGEGGGSLAPFGYVVTALFADGNINLNITAMGRGDIVSPFHAVFYYLKCRRLLREVNRAT